MLLLFTDPLEYVLKEIHSLSLSLNGFGIRWVILTPSEISKKILSLENIFSKEIKYSSNHILHLAIMWSFPLFIHVSSEAVKSSPKGVGMQRATLLAFNFSLEDLSTVIWNPFFFVVDSTRFSRNNDTHLIFQREKRKSRANLFR